jgi:hypothetical protein
MWIIRGIAGRGEAPACAGTRNGAAVVMGTARCVWDDIARCRSKLLLATDRGQEAAPTGTRFKVIAINGMVLFYPGRIHHAVSMHPAELGHWQKLREIYGDRDPSTFLTHSYRRPEEGGPPDVVWDIQGAIAGTSGLLAVMVGLALGYQRIILCGVPLDGSGHVYDDPETITRQFTQEWLAMEWAKAGKQYFDDRVRSMSGNTRAWFGEPTKEWLHGSLQQGATGEV